MGLKKKLLKVFGRKKKKNTATAKTVKTAGPVLYIPTSRTPASMYSSSASLFRPVSSYSGSSSGFSGYGRLSPPGFSGSGYGRLSGSGFSGGSSVVSSGLSGLSGRSGRNSSGNTYVHLPGKYQMVLNGTPARVDPGAMIARVGDIIAYTDKYDGNTYEWLGKVKSLEKDGVVVEQRGYFEKTENVAGRTVKLPQEVRNVRVSRFKRVSPKDVKQYERQGWKFSHAYGGNGGNGGGNGSSANRSLLRGLTTGQFITFVYRGKPVYGQIEKIDRRTGEVHMKKNPQGMYNQNLLGIPIPTPGSTAEIKFRPSANSQITSLGSATLPKAYKIALQKKGFQNLSVGFKLSNNNGNKMSMNFIVKQALGDHARTFETWDAQLSFIKTLQNDDEKKNAIQEFVVKNLIELEKLDELIEKSKNKPQFTKDVKNMKKQLLDRIKTLYPTKDGEEKFDEMMDRAKGIVAKERPSQGWFGWGLGKAAATAGLLWRAGAAAGRYFVS